MNSEPDLDRDLKGAFDQIIARTPDVGPPPRGEDTIDEGAHRRTWLSVAAAVILVVGTVAIGLGRPDGHGDQLVDPVPTPAPQDTSGTLDALPDPSSVTSADPASTTSLPEPASTTPETPVSALAVADVRSAQLAALRSLQGFSATASRKRGRPRRDDHRAGVQFALLADGSFYNETGPGLFQSYDPSTGTVLAAIDNGSGGIAYQRIVGQQDNSLPLLMLAGYDPTIPIFEDPQSYQVAEVVQYDGAPAWQVTTTFEFKKSPDFVSEGGGPPPDDFTQVTTQTVDPDTGLVVAYTVTSTNANQTTIDTHLTDVEAIDTMPDAFPGTVPEGASVDESGNPTGFQAVTANDAASGYGIPTPIPASADTATIATMESLTYDDGADSRIAEPSGTYRQTTFTTMNGFVKTAVTLIAQTIADGHEPPEHMAKDGSYLCFDLDGNDQCEPPALAPGDDADPNTFEITTGALDGQLAAFDGQSLSTQLPPFRITIRVDNLDDAKTIANTFTLLAPV